MARVCTVHIMENKCNHAHTTAVKHPRGKIQSISHICARRPLRAKLNSPDDFYCKEFHIFAPTWKQLAWWCFIFIVSDRYYFYKRVVTHTLRLLRRCTDWCEIHFHAYLLVFSICSMENKVVLISMSSRVKFVAWKECDDVATNDRMILNKSKNLHILFTKL